MLSASIPILDALIFIEKNCHDRKIREISSTLQLKINGGMGFAQALNYLYGNVFGYTYITLVKAGEASGELDITLNRILLLLKKQEDIRNKIITASIYPALLLLAVYGILVCFANFVFPKFNDVITSNGGEISASSLTVIRIMNMFSNHSLLILLILIGTIYGIYKILKIPSIKNILDGIILQVPIINSLVEYFNLANFSTVVYIAYEAGLTITSCLELANRAVGNLVIKSRISDAVQLLKQGNSLTTSLQTTRAVPPMFLSIISAGEESGSMGKMFQNVTLTIDRKLELALQVMLKLFEPIAILIIAGIIGALAIVYSQAYIGMLNSII